MGVAKLCGADVELANFLVGVPRAGSTCAEAAGRILAEIGGVPGGLGSATATATATAALARADGQGAGKDGPDRDPLPAAPVNPQDRGRTFLPTNGGCIYIDSDHVEIALPECLDARSHVAHFHAMLRTVREAQVAAAARLPEGVRLEVLANASDGLGASYGAHLDLLTTRDAFEDIFQRRSHYLAWLASFQVSAMVVSGQGKVGAEAQAAPVDYQISQRADFFDRLTSVDTMARRGIVNSRDEPLCGPDTHLARLHVICFDPMLCHVARYVTVGTMQIAVAMIEAREVDPSLLLDAPVEALAQWSRDPSLRATARLADGRRVTIVDLQRLFFTRAARFVAAGRCEGDVADAAGIIDAWGDLLDALDARDFDALAPRLDWVLKLRLLEHVLARRPDLSWQSPSIKALDHLYASLDDGGLFVTEDRAGHIERVASEIEIARARGEPPEDTRAWARAMVLRWHRDLVADLDWDWIDLHAPGSEGAPRRRLWLTNPLGFTKAGLCGDRSPVVGVTWQAADPDGVDTEPRH